LLLEADPHEDGLPAEGSTRRTPPSPRPDPGLQTLMLTERTAEALVSAADRHADNLRAGARVAADRLSSDARLHADRVRAEADDVLTQARAAAERTADMATVRAEAIRRRAEVALTRARDQARLIVSDGHHQAEQIKIQAQRAFDDVVGGLGMQRDALQQQLQALDTLDRTYRERLTAVFRKHQQALWAPRSPGSDDPAGPAS
jgi:hypothetical protein